MKLLIIRPQPGADATARRVREAGFEPVVIPLFAIEPLPWPNLSATDYDALLLSSGNAVRAGGEQLAQLAGLPLYAVGAATARALAQVSLRPDFIGNDGVAQLISRARKNGHGKLLWLAGENHSKPEYPAEIEVAIRIIYRSRALAAPASFDTAILRTDAVMLHSARAARHFADSCDGAGILRQDVGIAAFSQSIADSAGHGWAATIIAPRPNDGALLSEVRRHFTTATRDPY